MKKHSTAPPAATSTTLDPDELLPLTTSITVVSRLETTQGALARRGFVDPAAAKRLLESWQSGQQPLLDLIADTADADLALAGLDRLRGKAPSLLDDLLANSVLARQLIMVLGASVAMQQHLVRHPEAIGQLERPVVRADRNLLRAEMLSSVGADPDIATPLAEHRSGDELRVAYRTALLRVTARDLCAADQVEAMEDVAAELADLADATLEAALAIARVAAGEAVTRCRLAVVALGKCGGQELNYVSDVDVLFVAEPALDEAGESRASGQDAVVVATPIAAELMRICSAHTAAGTIWEVDAALRPEGHAGPLVRTLASHQAYYQKWAKTWEFQAMLKARPCAGDLELGQQFVDLVAKGVWQVAERDHFVADTQAMRKRVVDHIPIREATRELKLGEGGLRDVEFSVQLLQLVHGRADERLRARGTLVGLQALIDNGYVGREDGKDFADAYRFLRTLEHRIQLFRLRRTHLLPEDGQDLQRLGRSLGYAGGAEELQRNRKACTAVVRRLRERLFYSPLLDAVARIPSSELRLTTTAATDRLKALGFADPGAALRHIAALSQGVSRQAEIQRQLLPAMLGWFAAAPNPDHGLLAFRQVSEALGRTPWYLRALRDEGMMAERLARILASSRYAVQLLTRAPQTVQMLADDDELVPRSLDELSTEMGAAAGRQQDPAAAVEAIRAIRRRELFRVAAGDLLGLNDVLTVGDALTDLASATIDIALGVAVQSSGADQVPAMAVIAMGRWGGREMSYASDADAMFVLDDAGATAERDPVKVAAAIITQTRQLLTKPGVDPVLSIDIDLRPEGKGGAPIRSLSAYRSYYSKWSATWELQALVRADALAGEAGLGRELMAEIDQRRWPEGGLSSRQLMEIRKMKARVESERLPRGADPATHTKLGPGGLADIEWTVQLLQLQHGWRLPALRTTRTIEALRAACRQALVTEADAHDLEVAWLFASRVRNQIMLVRGRASDSFPTDSRELAAVAELMGFGPAKSSHFLAEYRRISRRARTVVEKVFWGDGTNLPQLR